MAGTEGGGKKLHIVAWPARLRHPHANPYPHLLARALAARGCEVVDALDHLKRPWRSFDLLHLHWPESGFARRGLGRLILLWPFLLGTLAHLHGARVVWTVHNVRPHESAPAWAVRLFHRLFAPFVDGLLFLGPHGVAELARQDFARHYAGCPASIVPHGHYRSVYPHRVSREEARRRFGFEEDERVLLLFGRLRTYKGVDDLVAALAGLSDPRIRLLVAGQPHPPEEGPRLAALCADDPRIRLEARPIPPEEVQPLFAAADLVVLPYRRITNSGAAILALSLARPLLAPRLGELPHLAEAVPSWITLYDPPLRPEVLEQALARPPACDPAELEAFLRATDWETIADRTADFFVRLCGGISGGNAGSETFTFLPAPGRDHVGGAEVAVPPPVYGAREERR